VNLAGTMAREQLEVLRRRITLVPVEAVLGIEAVQPAHLRVARSFGEDRSRGDRGVLKLADAGAAAVLLTLDTPGGLDSSMRQITQAILNAEIPVIGYVSPQGARAASAGTFILLSTNVAAMAPGTNLGAATPIQIGAPGLPGSEPDDARKREPGDKRGDRGEPTVAHPGMAEKAVNDAVAYIRSLAQMRGRNVEWAEKAVRQAAVPNKALGRAG